MHHAFEGFSELSIVPYSGGDAIKWVEVNAAGRAYDYNTFGSGVTGKISGLVRTAGGIALRGTYGTAFRAPNVGELFAGQADAFLLLEDPCDTLPPSAKNPVTLDPMTAAQCAKQGVPTSSVFGSAQQRARWRQSQPPAGEGIGTAGVVYEPFRASTPLDYWNIKINTRSRPARRPSCRSATGWVTSAARSSEIRDPRISYLSIAQNVGRWRPPVFDPAATSTRTPPAPSGTPSRARTCSSTTSRPARWTRRPRRSRSSTAGTSMTSASIPI
jgi:hypothetical protein